MDDRIAAHRQRLAEELGSLDMRALFGFGNGAPTHLDLAATMVLPRLQRPSAETDTTPGSVLAELRHVVLLGEPGAGKSTLLRYLCLAHAHPDPELRRSLARDRNGKSIDLPGDLVPIYLRLSDFVPRRESAGEFAAFLREHLDEVVVHALDTRGLLCLDGLDEIGNDGARRRVARCIESWLRDRHACCWISTRKHGILALRAPFEIVEILPFGWSQIRHYLITRERLRGTPRDDAHARAEAWLWRVQANAGLFELIRTPLLLVLALAVEAADHHLPVERVHLYEQAIAALIKHWNEDRRIDALQRATGEFVDADQVCRALADVALDLHARRELGGSTHHRDLLRRFAERLGGESPATGALEVLERQAGLLVRVGDDVRFWHPSFGEYLAATALARTIRGRPARLLRTASSVEGREVVRMAIGWTRTIDGNPEHAAQLFDALLDDEAAGPWARLFGAHVRLAVDVALDGQPLDDAGFSQLLMRVALLVARAPLYRNRELLLRLSVSRPDHLCPPELTAHLSALFSSSSPITGEAAVAVMRWIALRAPDDPVARACCKSVLARDNTTSTWTSHDAKPWAALGLLRAGEVHERIVRAVAPLFTDKPASGRSQEAELAKLLAPARDHLRPQLRALWTSLPAPPGERHTQDPARELRQATVNLLAILADDGDDILTALFAEVLAEQFGREKLGAPLRWLACRSEAARKLLGDALVAPDAPTRHAAVDLLRDMFGRIDQVDAAGDAAIAGLQRVRRPGAIEVLTRLITQPAFRREHTLLDTIAGMLEPDPARRIMMRRWSDLPDTAGELRWLLAGSLWSRTHAAFTHDDLESLATCLLDATRHLDPTLAVTSASLLAERWDILLPSSRSAVTDAWLRALHYPGEPAKDEPVGSVCKAAWDGLHTHLADLDEPTKSCLRATLEGDHAVAATIAAQLLFDDPDSASRVQARFLTSLNSDDLQVVFVAYHALLHRPIDDDLLNHWYAAAIRLALAGLRHGIRGHRPAPRSLVELYLATPYTASRDHALSLLATEKWLAEHPDAFVLATAAISTQPSPRTRRVALLAACLDSPERLAALVALATADPSIRPRALSAIRQTSHHTLSAAPLQPALEQARITLLRHGLLADDLTLVADAVDALDCWVDAPELPAARARLLDAGDLASTRRMLAHWLRIPSDDRPVFALEHFRRPLPALTAALHRCLADLDPLHALEAGLLLRRLTGDTAPLRDLCHAILPQLDSPSAERTFFDDHPYELAHWFDTDDTRALRQQVDFERQRSPRVWAALTLDDLGEDITPWLAVLFDSHARREWSHLPESAIWIFNQRPAWIPRIEPRIVDLITQSTLWQVHHLTQQLRPVQTPAIARALALRWPEWLSREPQKGDDSFQGFVGTPGPDDELRAIWRSRLDSPDSQARDLAMLALATCEPLDAALADAAIDAFLFWRPAARHAFKILRQPHNLAMFAARRRLRAATWDDPEHAYQLWMLWSDDDTAADCDILLPLLRAALRHDDTDYAYHAAATLAVLAPDEALSAMHALAERSTRAAAWLYHHGHPTPTATARLWQAFEQDDYWDAAAAALLPAARDDPRFIHHLTRRAREPYRGEVAIHLLADISSDRTLMTIVECLAQDGNHWESTTWLEALARGRRPGRPLGEAGPHHEPVDDDLHKRLHELRLGHDHERLALALVKLAAQLPLDLSGACARLLDHDPTAVTALLRRVHAGEPTSDDVAALHALLDLRPEDSPGRRLARLYWRHHLRESELLERDVPAATIAALAARGHTPEALLAALLADAFAEHVLLRRFMADLDLDLRLHNDLPGPHASLTDHLHEASRLLLARGLARAAINRLIAEHRISPHERRAWDAAVGLEPT